MPFSLGHGKDVEETGHQDGESILRRAGAPGQADEKGVTDPAG